MMNEPTPKWAMDMKAEITGQMDTGFTRVHADHALLKTHVEIQNGRVATLETRLNTQSIAVKEASNHDMNQERVLADEILRREKLEKDVASIKAESAAQTVMLTDMRNSAAKLLGNPTVRMIFTMLGATILTWLAAHQGQPPPLPHMPPSVTPAPTP